VPLGDDVDLNAIASTTPGMVGADLANLVNEAALMAARRSHEKVMLNDFSDALEKIVLGTERRIMMSQEEKTRTAYHESGHALLGMLQPGADPVRKISIIPRGRALGVTLQSPDADKYSYGADYLRGKIIGMLGGRAAERSSTETCRPAPRTTWSRPPDSLAAWSDAGACPSGSDLSRSSTTAPSTPSASRSCPSPRWNWSTPRSARSSTSATTRPSSNCTITATSWRPHAALLDKETLEEVEAYEVAGIERGAADEGPHRPIRFA
jgi:cell division protease FtsH